MRQRIVKGAGDREIDISNFPAPDKTEEWEKAFQRMNSMIAGLIQSVRLRSEPGTYHALNEIYGEQRKLYTALMLKGSMATLIGINSSASDEEAGEEFLRMVSG